jgi:hypothetical protein
VCPYGTFVFLHSMISTLVRAKPALAFFFLYLSLYLVSCSKEKQEQPLQKETPAPAVKKVDTSTAKKDTIAQAKDTTLQAADTTRHLYKSFYLDGAKSLNDLSKDLGPEKMSILFKINRRDLKHLKMGDSVVIPLNGNDEMIYSPYPAHISALDSVKKILLVSRQVQAFGAYENGKLVKWGPTSTGKKATPTPEALFHTNWKSLETHSTVDEAWILKWYFNLDNREGISLHEYDLPGYPASHSCIRLLSPDAQWIYNWAEQWRLSPDRKTIAKNGTPVLVFGDYAYGKTPPWKKLARNEHVTDLKEEDLARVIGKFLK